MFYALYNIQQPQTNANLCTNISSKLMTLSWYFFAGVPHKQSARVKSYKVLNYLEIKDGN